MVAAVAEGIVERFPRGQVRGHAAMELKLLPMIAQGTEGCFETDGYD